ncbi:hypothetical protein DPMN_181826 [Dreissena polymorpha]|uniref:H15 domain-containing protein n=1 Tax=Dreissena polymorpha TaxID=45954 RepID=A0A9D4I419_DREPO|nr:hypothetical protein DPMN_181826 [Dreissena polymorpha]
METPAESATVEAPEVGAAAKKAPRPKPTHPTYIEMAKDAIATLAEPKGATVPAIVSFICGKHKLDVEVVKQHLKPALAKGITEGVFVRPKSSADSKGFTGRFKLDKAKAAEEIKAKKKKEKEAQAKVSDFYVNQRSLSC